MKFKFGKSFLGDLEHKMNIVSDEPELQECYSLTQEQIDTFLEQWPSCYKTKEIEIPSHMVECVKGEMENMSDIAWSNAKSEGIGAIGWATSIDRQLTKLST